MDAVCIYRNITAIPITANSLSLSLEIALVASFSSGAREDGEAGVGILFSVGFLRLSTIA